MHIDQNAPPRALRGRTAASRFLPADWNRGAPPGYTAALKRLRNLRERMEAAITDAIAELDALDAIGEDLEATDPIAPPFRLGDEGPLRRLYEDDCSEPSLAASEQHPICGRYLGEYRDRTGDQTTWAAGEAHDHEDDAGDNPEEDHEREAPYEGDDGADNDGNGVADFIASFARRVIA